MALSSLVNLFLLTLVYCIVVVNFTTLDTVVNYPLWSCVYYLLGNLHPKFQSSLKSIQLLCVARNPIIVKYGIEEILKPVVESIQELEKVKIQSACKRTITLE